MVYLFDNLEMFFDGRGDVFDEIINSVFTVQSYVYKHVRSGYYRSNLRNKCVYGALNWLRDYGKSLIPVAVEGFISQQTGDFFNYGCGEFHGVDFSICTYISEPFSALYDIYTGVFGLGMDDVVIINNMFSFNVNRFYYSKRWNSLRHGEHILDHWNRHAAINLSTSNSMELFERIGMSEKAMQGAYILLARVSVIRCWLFKREISVVFSVEGDRSEAIVCFGEETAAGDHMVRQYFKTLYSDSVSSSDSFQLKIEL